MVRRLCFRALLALLVRSICAASLFPEPQPLLAAQSEPATDPCASPSDSAVPRPTTGRPLLFDQFISPLVAAATQRRAQLESQDPSYETRVDPALNAHRVNVAILGYGEEHEQTYDDQGVSPTILTLDLDTWDMVTISLSRDIRTPELEDRSAVVPPRDPITLRYAYRLRGFEGVRPILEDMTGLAIDYQVAMKDVFLRDYLQDVSGPVNIVVPKAFHTNAYRLGGEDHHEDYLAPGLQTLDPDHAMTFVLGEDWDPSGKADERSYRKNLLLKTLSCGVRQRLAARDAGFILNLAKFSMSEVKDQNLSADFDFQMLAGGLIRMGQTLLLNGGEVDSRFPQASGARQLVVHDEVFGDGGVRRVHHMTARPDDHGQADNPLVKEELRMGSLGPYMLIPIGGNPYADDLVSDYWQSVRQLVRGVVLGTS